MTPADVLDAAGRRERPILFSAPMVRAILAGTKTQTRRIVKPAPVYVTPFIGRDNSPTHEFGLHLHNDRVIEKHVRCPYGAPGDRLWVREAFCLRNPEFHPERGYWYAATDDVDGPKWTPSIYMPRAASRITLEVTRVRVERLHDITEEDARAEGVESLDGMLDEVELCRIAKLAGSSYEDARGWFAALWCQINGEDSWDANPWVWVVEFKRMESAARWREEHEG